MSSGGDVTRLLRQWRQGDERALDVLMPLVYSHLRRIAQRVLSGEREGHTLQATALVHEAYLQLAGSDLTYEDRAHLFAILARTMRRILVDHARAHLREKRGGGASREPLDDVAVLANTPSPAVLDVDQALSELAQQDERKARLIELLYFGGLTAPQAAEALGVSESTIQREARLARAWIRHRLTR